MSSSQATRPEALSSLREALAQRERELNCLYGLTTLIDEHSADVHRVVELLIPRLPAAFQDPDTTCARVRLAGRRYTSAGFRATRWSCSADIVVDGLTEGMLEIFRTAATAPEDLFLPLERLLVAAIAERLGRVSERIRAQRQLEIERNSLDDTNTALREVLARLQEEKLEIGRAVHEQVSKVIMPLLLNLERELLPRRPRHIELLKNHLAEITSSFTRELSKEFLSLTPTEIQVCHMVRSGLSSKEIAALRRVSVATVSRQRDSIRRKLGLANRRMNLVTFLRSYGDELPDV